MTRRSNYIRLHCQPIYTINGSNANGILVFPSGKVDNSFPVNMSVFVTLIKSIYINIALFMFGYLN